MVDAVGATKPQRKYQTLQAGRAFAALLVVLHHVSSAVEGKPLWVHPAVARWLFGTALGVAFFFVLSGIVIFNAHWNDVGHPERLPSYCVKRFRRIYPIYWLVLIPVLFGQLRHVDTQFPFHRDPFVILSSILLVHIHSSGTNLVVAWTLFHEVMFYAVFALLLLHKRIGVVLLGAWFLCSIANIPHATNLPPNFFSAVHVLFGMGMLAAWMLRRNRTRRPRLLLALGTLAFMVSVAVSGWMGATTIGTYILAGLGTALALLGAAVLEKNGQVRVPRQFIFLGDASYSIYLAHYPVITHLARFFFLLDAHVHLPIAVWMALLFSIATAAGCLLHVFVERPVLNWINGPRSEQLQPVASAA